MSTLCRLCLSSYASREIAIRCRGRKQTQAARGCVNEGWQKRYFHKNYDRVECKMSPQDPHIKMVKRQTLRNTIYIKGMLLAVTFLSRFRVQG